MKRMLTFFILLLFSFSSYSQDKPLLRQQIPLDNISDVYSSPGVNSFLAVGSNGNYTFIDQYSKLQAGTITIDIGSLAVPGLGACWLRNDHSFIVSNGSQLLCGDIISGKTDTIFNALKFPEFLIRFQPLVNDTGKLLIITKSYPVDAKGSIQFLKTDAKGKMTNDDSRNCRLLIYDLKSRTILRSAGIDFEPTVLLQTNAGITYAGTLEGDIKKLDTTWLSSFLLHAFDKPVHSLALVGNLLVALPHMEKKYLNEYGGGELFSFDLTSGERKSLLLPKEDPPPGESFEMKPAPNNSVKKMLVLPSAGALLLNYGFSRLLRIEVPSLDTSSYPIPFRAADLYCFNRDSSQLLLAVEAKPGVFKTSGDLLLYDLKRKTVASDFRRSSPIEIFNTYKRLYDRQGNYHIIGFRSGYTGRDSLLIFSSNRTAPCVLEGPRGSFILNEADTTLTITHGRTVCGKLRLENLFANYYRFSLDYRMDAAMDTLHPSIFELLLDTRKMPGIKFPYSITQVNQVGGDKYLLTGYTPAKTNLLTLLMIDTNGKQLFRTRDMAYTDDKGTMLSPSGNYIAFTSGDIGKTQLEVWDWRANKKLMEKMFTGRPSLMHYCFDRSRDILFFGSNIPDKAVEVFQFDPKQPSISARKIFSDNACFSFAVDMANDRIASEGYTILQLHRLSDKRLLWQQQPYSSYFKVRLQPNGFEWASEKEWHYLSNSNDHLYFTCFQPLRPLQILNSRLYSGERTAVNNMAFVYRGKAYLPTEFDVYFNRPDSVLEKAGSGNRSYNELLQKIVQKRKNYLRVKDLDQVLSAAPGLSIEEKEKIPELVRERNITLKLKLEQKVGDPVTLVRVKDNGVELPVTGKGPAFSIPLVNGLNRIEVTAETMNGFRSVPDYITVNAAFEAPAPKCWFIGVGVSRYLDSSMNLRYADKDIRDLAIEFSKKFPGAVIDTFLNGAATASAIRDIHDQLKNTAPEDKVFLGFSGHGLVDNNGNFYFATYDMDFAKPEKKGFSYSEMELLLADIPARNRLLWIDACHSGELDQKFLTDTSGIDARVRTYSGTKGGIATASEGAVSLQNSFELMKELFSNYSRNDGTVVISAAGGLEFALEDEKWQNGVFTYAFKKGLLEAEADKNKDGKTSVNELKEYISAKVEALTGGRQRPTCRKESIEFDWDLW